FLRSILAIQGNPALARRSSSKNLFSLNTFDNLKREEYIKYFYSYSINKYLNSLQKRFEKETNNKFGANVYGNALRYGKFAVIYASFILKSENINSENIFIKVTENVDSVLVQWLDFENYVQKLNY